MIGAYGIWGSGNCWGLWERFCTLAFILLASKIPSAKRWKDLGEAGKAEEPYVRKVTFGTSQGVHRHYISIDRTIFSLVETLSPDQNWGQVEGWVMATTHLLYKTAEHLKQLLRKCKT